MLGTLNGALEVRQVKLVGQAIVAEVEGVNEVRDGLPVLTEVRVHYRLRVPADRRDAVDRALARHQEKCPTAASLRGAVAVSWTAEVVEEPEGRRCASGIRG
jgi:organic hydroperoxide reductase OsmC/OhrA